MSQRRYIEKVRKHFNMEKCKLVVTPFDVNSKLLKLLDEEFENVLGEMEGITYKTTLGSLV